MYRICEFDPKKGPPNYRDLIARIHPVDSTQVDQTVQSWFVLHARMEGECRLLSAGGRTPSEVLDADAGSSQAPQVKPSKIPAQLLVTESSATVGYQGRAACGGAGARAARGAGIGAGNTINFSGVAQ